MKRVETVFLLFIYTASILFSGTTGKLTGKASDSKTGEALPGATVQIVGTSTGAVTNESGEFVILNIPPGNYSVKVSFIGYNPFTINNVRINADFTTTIEAKLVSTSVDLNEVIVTAERKLIQKDATSTVAVIEAAEIKALPIQNVNDALVLNAGIVESRNRGGSDDGIHVRGGRTSEVSYIIDGVEVDNQLYGGQASDVTRAGVSTLTVLSGTFNAEYGQAQSGIINVVTQEGSSKFAGTLRLTAGSFETFRQEATMTSGIPGMENIGKVFLSIDNLNTTSYLNKIKGPTYTAKLANGEKGDTTNNFNFGLYEKNLRANSKISFQFGSGIKLQLAGIINDKESRGYSHYFKQMPESNGIDVNKSTLFSGTLTHAIDQNTFYELRASKFEVTNQYYLYPEELKGDYRRIFVPVSAWDGFGGTSNYEFAGNYALAVPTTYAKWYYEKYGGLQLWRDITSASGKVLFSKGDIVTTDMIARLQDSLFTGLPGGMKSLSIKAISRDDFVQDAKNATTTFSGSISTQLDKYNAIKAGFDFKKHTINNYFVNGVNEYWNYEIDPVTFDPDTSMNFRKRHYNIVDFNFEPWQYSVFVQDKIEVSDIIVNVGLRYDYIEPKAPDVYKGYDPNLSPEEAKALITSSTVKPKSHISPRIGIAFPILENAKIHGSYGVFYQFPDYNFLYQRFDQNHPDYPYIDLGKGIPTVGNPNLKPEITNAFEFGAEVLFTDDFLGSVTVFYKDTYDYISTVQKKLRTTFYFEYTNLDYANSRGIEFSFKKRMSNHLAFTATYTYSRAEGNADNASTHFSEYINSSVLGIVPPKRTVTLSWDQPHTLSFSSTISYDTWGTSFVGQFGSGLPFTPTDARGSAIGEINSQRQPWTGTIDMRTFYTFKFQPVAATIYLDVTNLLNKRNIYRVFTSTGTPDFSLNPNVSPENLHRPNYYGPLRHIQLGVEIGL